jgi:hypothetical protein
LQKEKEKKMLAKPSPSCNSSRLHVGIATVNALLYHRKHMERNHTPHRPDQNKLHTNHLLVPEPSENYTFRQKVKGETKQNT